MHHSLLLFEANKGITFVWSQYWTSKSRHWLNFIWLHINKSTKISKSFQDQGWIVFTNYWMVGVSVVLMYLEQLGLSNIYTIIGHRKAIRIWFQPRACARAMCVCVHPCTQWELVLGGLVWPRYLPRRLRCDLGGWVPGSQILCMLSNFILLENELGTFALL